MKPRIAATCGWMFLAYICLSRPLAGLVLCALLGLWFAFSAKLIDLLPVAVFFVTATLMVQLGLIHFVFNEQSQSLLDRGVDPLSLLFSLEIWGPRYFLSYPAVVLSRNGNLDLDFAYTLYNLVPLAMVVFLLIKYCDNVFDYITDGRKLSARMMIVAFWLMIAMFMNGRLVVAFLGMALILHGQVMALREGRLGPLSLLIQSVGVFCSMMSSGTVMVAVGQVVVGGILIYRKTQNPSMRYKIASLFIVFVASVVFLPVVIAGIVKNLEFFNGKVSEMLMHGVGRVFLSEFPFAILAILLVAIILAGTLVGSKGILETSPYLLPAAITPPLAVAGGLFGLSTLLMLLPSVVVLLVYWGFAAVSLRLPHDLEQI